MRSTPTPDVGDRGEDRHEALHDEGREPERELVDEDHRGPRHQRLSEHDHLLLAAGKRPRRGAPALLQLGEQIERVLGPALRFIPRQDVGGDAQVVGDRQLGQEPPPLGDHGHARPPDPLRSALREVLGRRA